MAESTITPMARAMPPSDMMLAFIPSRFIRMMLANTPVGSTKMATSELRKWSRKTIIIRATTVISSSSFHFSVSTARSIRAERSYSALMSTPGGSPER